MVERIIRPLSSCGKVTIPKDIRIEYQFKDYVEFIPEKDGILIKPLEPKEKEVI